jgi:predicted Zn finger-like uncharacterized protein
VQANCPQCQQKIVIDDARVPERAFSVKCPKCQNTVKFPGRGGPVAATPPPITDAAAAPASVAEGGESAASGSPATVVPDDMRVQLMAQLRREMTIPAADAGSAGRALVTLPDRALSGAVTVMLTRQGYVVDTVDDPDEASRLIEQGVYSLIVLARTTPPQGKESVLQRIQRLSPDARRRLFLVLVGDEWKTGDGLQAFTVCADLVLSSRDAPSADVIVRNTVQERHRIYQIYLDSKNRHDASVA